MPALPPKKIWRLRVIPDREGKLTPWHPATHSDPDWWGAVLADPRARTHFKNEWEDVLGRHRGEMFLAKCDRCLFSRFTQVESLIDRFGLNTPCASVAAGLKDDQGTCRFEKTCLLTYETTTEFKKPER